MLERYQEAFQYFLPVLLSTTVYGLVALRWAVGQFRTEQVLFREAERFDLASWFRHLVRDPDLKALREAGPAGMLLAGGTDLLPNMKRRQQTPEVVIALRGVQELKAGLAHADGSISLGAGLTLAETVRSPYARQDAYRALTTAAGKVATTHIQNMGTLGGNLCLDTRCNYYDQNYEWRKAIDFCKKAPDGDDVIPGPPGHTLDINGSILDACTELSMFDDIGERVGQYLNNENWRNVVDQFGKLTLRHGSRLHHLGIGRAHAGTPVLILIAATTVTVISKTGHHVIASQPHRPGPQLLAQQTEKPRQKPGQSVTDDATHV